MAEYEGYIVHAWSVPGQARYAGRLSDGRSFAIVVRGIRPSVVVPESRAEAALAFCGADARIDGSLRTMDGQPVTRIRVYSMDTKTLVPVLANAGIPVVAEAKWPAEDYLTELGITGLVRIEGNPEPGRRVGLVFTDPVLSPSETAVTLSWLSFDIETDRSGRVVAVALRMSGTAPAENSDPQSPAGEVLFWGPDPGIPGVVHFEDEGSLIAAFTERVRNLDPDVITGWNILDFDLRVLAERASALRIPFDLGRAAGESARVYRRTTGKTVAIIPGRQALDALWLVRGSGERFESLTLDSVASVLLGEGKTVSMTGEEKLKELDRLYAEDPAAFCRYCLHDAELVLRILEKTGLHTLTVARAALTGVSLDLAWTSIPAFERIYGLELYARGILEPSRDESAAVSGAAGGMVLEPFPGLFSQVLVLDFRSLYPSIMRTFNIDPLSHRICLNREARTDDIVAPNGARFDRQEGILPGLIARYFAERERAQNAGDETAAYVYKILMNSFYGVLGSGGCIYGRTELAGAITGFGRLFLEYARDFFEERGFRVVYGDTDSVFVRTGLPEDATYEQVFALADPLAAELNAAIGSYIQDRFGLESFLRIRFDKAYKKFMIPRLRLDAGDGKLRGRAKGYAGLKLDAHGGSGTEVKGMEAARSDYTPLARRFQTELLDLIFQESPASSVGDYVHRLLTDLRVGKLDTELVYRKVLRRSADAYQHAAPPQVRAARMLGWTAARGSVSYLWTTNGPEPVELLSHPIDYRHYIGHQLRPIWESIAEAADLKEAALSDDPDNALAPGKPLAAIYNPGPLTGLKPFDQQLELTW